ncbi:MAG TPA: NADPH:quinone reductase [Gaiellaceae bacterium]|nr:NADPH:quinone reductase [Gaiellaceae bacterium]
MLAAVYERTGPAGEVLEVREVETPEPDAGWVRVRMHVSGVNPTDWKSRSGSTSSPTRPFQVPHHDGAGVIDAVGPGVPETRVGERVWVFLAAYTSPYGTAAEYTVVPAAHAVPLPDGASFELGAGLGVPALTAHRCLTADGPIAGATVLVAGGAGAVGHSAIELARFLGAKRVLATASTDAKQELARAAGADPVVDYRRDDAAERIRAAAPDGVDRIVEVSISDNAALDLEVLAPHGVVASYASTGAPLHAEVRPLMTKNVVLRFVLLYGVPEEALVAGARDVTRAVEAGALTALPEHHFTLRQVAEAQGAVEHGATGKVLVQVG